MRELNRMPVNGPASLYTTFGIRAPKSSHWAPATCEEVNCPYQARGFKVSVDEAKVIGQQNAVALRKDTQRSPKESRDEFGMTIFEYPPGTRCMGEHPKGTATRTHTKPEFWVEEFAEVQDKIISAIEKRD